jgi:hypothetical protein
MSEVQNETNEVQFKDAARRMVAFYAEHGIKVPFLMSLEALTVAVGDKTYRRFRKLLEKPVVPEILDTERWLVTAVYTDNDQPYDQYYPGTDAIEAAVNCQLERLGDEEGGGEVDVVSVLDRSTDRIADTGNVGDTSISSHGFALRRLVDIVKDMVPMDSTMTAQASEHLAAEILLLDEFLGAPGTDRKGERTRGSGEAYLDDVLDKWADKCLDAVFVRLEGYGMSAELDPVQAIRNVAQYALDAVQIKGWAGLDHADMLHVYHAKGLTVYLEQQLRTFLIEEPTLMLSQHAAEEDVSAGVTTRAVTWFDVLDQMVDREAGKPADRIVVDTQTGDCLYKVHAR